MNKWIKLIAQILTRLSGIIPLILVIHFFGDIETTIFSSEWIIHFCIGIICTVWTIAINVDIIEWTIENIFAFVQH